MNLFSIARKKGGAIAWTDEQVAYIKDEYINNNRTLQSLSTEFSCSPATIKTLLRRNRVKVEGSKRGYPRNENYFNQIDNSEKAYWLGFLYADGCVSSNNNTISVNSIDIEHLFKLKNAIGAVNHSINTFQSTKFDTAQLTNYFSISDKSLHDDLIKQGCVPNKSLVLSKIPNIPRDYVSHFIRGYFDGDGSLHYLKGTNNWRISFVGTFEFLSEIRKELEIQSISIAKGSGNSYVLQISGRKQVGRILNYLYKDSTVKTRLDRKYDKFKECSLWVHRH